jgi:ankyrin repeat protein
MFFSLCTNGKLSEAKALYTENEGGIDFDFRYAMNTVLTQSSQKGLTDVVKWLIEIGVPLDVPSDAGQTPLIRAAERGHTEIAAALIEAGADTAATDKKGSTALDYAESRRFSEIVAMLSGEAEETPPPPEAVSPPETPATSEAPATPATPEPVKPAAAAAVSAAVPKKAPEPEVEIDISVPENMYKAIDDGDIPLVKRMLEAGFDLTNVPDSLLAKTRSKSEEINSFYLYKLIWQHYRIKAVGSRSDLLSAEKQEELLEMLPLFLEGSGEFNFACMRNLIGTDNNMPGEYYSAILAKFTDTFGINAQDDDNKGQTLLHYVCGRKGVQYEPWINAILDYHDVDVNLMSDEEYPPLYYACSYSSPEMVHLLLMAGADYDVLCGKENTPLLLVAAGCNTQVARPEIIETLIEFGADINAADKKGCTVLHLACIKQDVELCKLLLEKGADPCVTDSAINTPLHLFLAEVGGRSSWKTKIPASVYIEGITLLIEHNAQIEAANNELATPFCTYCRVHKESDVLVLKHLVSIGASVDYQDKFENTPLFYAVKWNRSVLVKFLLDNGADANIKNRDGVSPYSLALDENKRTFISMIEKSNVSVDADSDDMDAAFMRACRNGRRGAAEMLIKSGNIDITYVDDWGRTPLHYIAGMGSIALAKFALENGVDVNYTDNRGETALHFAANANHNEVFKLLLANGADSSVADESGVLPIHLVVNRGQHAMLKMLLENGADAKSPLNSGQSLLHIACGIRSKECVRILLEHGAEPDVADRSGITPLVVAVCRNQKEIVKILAEFGANLRVRDNEGDEGIHIAVLRGFKDMLTLLLDMGSDVNSLNDRGLAPIHLAAYCGYKDIFKFLVERGADFDIKSGAGKSCIDIASENGQKEIIEIIGIMQKRRAQSA